MSSRGDKVRGARKRRREKALAEAEKVLRVAAALSGKPRIIYRVHSANGIALMADDLAAAVQALQDILREPERAKVIAEDALATIVRKKMGLVVCPEGRLPVRIPALAAGEAGWAKWVIGVNPKERGGYMFDGPFLPMGQPSALPPGAVVMIAVGSGGTKRTVSFATVCIVQPTGELGGNPIRAHRSDWREMAERIAAYIKDSRGLPLLNDRRFPPTPPPPDPYGPPCPIAILLATALSDGPP